MSTILLLALIAGSSAWGSNGGLFPLGGPYGKALKADTKKGDYYSPDDLSPHLIWYVTFISDAFRDQFLRQYQKIYPEGQDFLAQKKAELWLKPNPEAEFFVALYAHPKEMTNLGDEQSLWDLSLEISGKTYKPSRVEAIDIDPFERRFFSYLNQWYRGYRVVFPVTGLDDRSRAFTLHLTSVTGHSSLKFD
ncbi:MAG TPA: hypothetical protein DF383_01755 [Deltaproteobacteria bacterium]|nr:hypothetical protein [Deltaproteobacteria bacterium]